MLRGAGVECGAGAIHGLSGTVVLTFLAGAELDPGIIRVKLAEVTIVGMVGFCPLSWDAPPSHSMALDGTGR
jgi:hypothetical protein